MCVCVPSSFLISAEPMSVPEVRPLSGPDASAMVPQKALMIIVDLATEAHATGNAPRAFPSWPAIERGAAMAVIPTETLAVGHPRPGKGQRCKSAPTYLADLAIVEASSSLARARGFVVYGPRSFSGASRASAAAQFIPRLILSMRSIHAPLPR